MDVVDAIRRRRAYRSLAPVEITPGILSALAGSVRLAPSCFNNQPWRLVFVDDPVRLEAMHEALSPGNAWARAASLIIAVFSREEDDCVIKSRTYHQFDTGLGVGFLLLRAVELGLVAHPIAGFSPLKTRKILDIPQDYRVISLIIVGRRASETSPVLSAGQVSAEKNRPARMNVEDFIHRNRFGQPFTG